MTMLPWMDPGAENFPPSSRALDEPNGLIAAGGDLSVRQLLAAYRRGIFPWYSEGQPILWWTPSPRLVLFPDQLHISRSLAKVLRQQNFHVTSDQAFETVMHLCAEPRPGQDGTWISDEMIAAYCQLHAAGHAHSVEVWRDGELAGGLYGVAIGPVFFGESMFSRVSNASKVAFTHLISALGRAGFHMIDCQVYTQHLASLGAIEIPREEFELRLPQPAAQPLPWPATLISQTPFEASIRD